MAQEKPNREQICERVQNGHRTGMRMQTRPIQSRYRMEMKQIPNGNGSQKRKKTSSQECKL